MTYNIDADTGSNDSGPGLTTVLQAIGNEHLDGNAQPIDVLALQELYSTPSVTLSYIVGQLNSIYGAGTYAYDATTDPTTGGTGGGPSGLIYNTKTVRDVAAVAIGSASGSGAARAPMRYTLQPVGAGAMAQFYLYVSHAKSGDAGTGQPGSDGYRRNVEATELRADAAALGPNAHVIYSGDFNVDSSSEPAYQTLVSPTIDSGVGQAVDPQNGSWALANLTDSTTKLQYRDDFQFVTGPLLHQTGLQLVPASYTVFGNNGSVSGSVNQAGNTALSDLSNQAAVLSALTTATDHLPVVADYAVIALPGDANEDGTVNGADLNIVLSNYNQTGTDWSHGDFNGDGAVNGADLNIVLSNYDQTLDSSAAGISVPEPSTAVLAGVAGLILAVVARRARRIRRR